MNCEKFTTSPAPLIRLVMAAFALLLWALPPVALHAQLPPNVPDAAKPLIDKPQNKAAIIRLTGEVDDVMRSSLERRIDVARKAGCTLVVYELDTYGGQLTSALEICKFTRNLDMPAVAWVHDKAYSAGAIIAVACPYIVMSPQSAMGDCEPIRAGMEAIPDDIKAKVRSPLLEDLRASADKNHYTPLLLEAMVIPEIEVFEMFNPNDPAAGYKYVDRAGHDALLKERVKNPAGEMIPVWRNTHDSDLPFDGTKSLLTVGAKDALHMGLAKREVSSEEDLRANLNIVGKDLLVLDYSWSELFVRWLVDSWVRFGLFVLMLVMAYIEFSHPGTLIPGIIALICLVLLIGAPLLTGLAQWWEILVIGAGVAIVVADLFAYGGVGLLAVPGFVLIAAGLVFSFIPSEPGQSIPTMPAAYRALQTGLTVVVFGTAVSIMAFFFLAKYLHITPGLRRIQLAPAGGVSTMASKIILDAAANPANDAVFPGALGTAASDLRPAGKARFDIHLVTVYTQGDYIPAGTSVVVMEVAPTRIVVKRHVG